MRGDGLLHGRGRVCSAAMKLIAKWMLCAAALLLVAYVYSGVEVRSFTAALVAVLIALAVFAPAFYQPQPLLSLVTPLPRRRELQLRPPVVGRDRPAARRQPFPMLL